MPHDKIIIIIINYIKSSRSITHTFFRMRLKILQTQMTMIIVFRFEKR